jgi:hypothetical protein
MAEKTYFGTFPKIITPGSLWTILYYIEKMALETAIPMGGVLQKLSPETTGLSSQ